MNSSFRAFLNVSASKLGRSLSTLVANELKVNRGILHVRSCRNGTTNCGPLRVPLKKFDEVSNYTRLNLINLNARCIHVSSSPLHKKSKSKSSKNLPVDELQDEDEDDDEDEVVKGDQVVRIRVETDRLDAVLKAGLSLSRNKIEKAFYADRIRVNGERPKKKSQSVSEGDEIDFVRRYNQRNPEHLDISRMELLEKGSYTRVRESDNDLDAKIPLKVKRSKNLTIENYKVPVKGNLDED